MAGIPPLIGFFSKQFVLYSAVQSGYYFMSIIAIVVSVISASYYLKIIKVLLTETGPSDINIKSELMLKIIEMKGSLINYNQTTIPNLSFENNYAIVDKMPKTVPKETLGHIHSFLISTLTLSILFFILKPSIFLNSISILSLSLYYF